MRLSCRPLNAVASVNLYTYAQQLEYVAGDGPTDLYFQLTDLTLDTAQQGFKPQGRRYCPAAGATMMVTLENVNSALQVTRAATQPYPTLDASIWKVTTLSTDLIQGTCALKVVLTEGAVVHTGRLEAAVLIHSPSSEF